MPPRYHCTPCSWCLPCWRCGAASASGGMLVGVTLVFLLLVRTNWYDPGTKWLAAAFAYRGVAAGATRKRLLYALPSPDPVAPWGAAYGRNLWERYALVGYCGDDDEERVSHGEPGAADRPQPNQSKDRAGVSGRRYRAGSANSKGNRKQRKKRKSRACMARAPDLRRCRCNLRFCVICGSLSLLRCDTPRAMTLAGKGSGETARYGQ